MPEYSITENEVREIIKCISEGYFVEELSADETMYIRLRNKNTVAGFEFPRCD